MPASKPILIKNPKSGIVTRCNSMQECADFFNVSRTAARIFLKNQKKLRMYHGHFVKYQNDIRDWPVDIVEKVTPNTYTGTRVITKHIVTGLMRVHRSIAQTARFLKVHRERVRRRLSKNTSIEYKGYIITLYTGIMKK